MIKNSYKKKFGAIIFALCACFCFGQNKTANITIVESEYQHQLNPHLTDYASDVQILTGLYEGLFSYNPITLEPQYAIASSYSISRDKKRWIFTINSNARFSDGTFITSDHVRSSWIKLLSTKDAPYASLLDIIEGAKEFRRGQIDENDVGIYAMDDSTLMVHLSKPAAYLAKILCHPAFSIVSQQEGVYSGPYCLGELSPRSQNSYAKIVLTKNPFYWDKDRVFTQQITFLQNNDTEENAYLYNNGDVDWISTAVDTKKLIEKKDLLFSAEYATSYLFFKVTGGPNKLKGELSPWNHSEFRQALFEAVPWKLLRSIYTVPATTFVYPLSGYPEVQGYDFTDGIQAQKLMKKAREKYGYSEDEIIPLKLDISKGSLLPNQITLLENAFNTLNIQLVVKEIPGDVYLDYVKQSQSDVFIYTWIGDFADPMAFLELFRSESSLNVTGFSNKKFDSLLDEACSTDGQAGYQLYAQAETLLLDECMIFPIHHPVTYNVINLNLIGGWMTNAFDIHPLKYLYKKENDSSSESGNGIII